MPGSALKDLHDGICQVEEKVKPDEEMNEYECRFLEGWREDADIKQENGQFGDKDQRAVCDLRNIRYLGGESQQNPNIVFCRRSLHLQELARISAIHL